MSFTDDPSLSRVLSRELSEGNSIVTTFRDPSGREVVQLARSLARDWGSELDDPEVYISDRIDTTAIDHGEYVSVHRETIETATGAIVAPFSGGERIAARGGSGAPRASRSSRGPIPRRVLLARCADAIEGDLRRAGVWREGVTEVVPFRAAFGADAMAFTDWLQLVFLPRLREIAARDLPLPGPGVAAHAVREFDGDDRFVDLCGRLSWLDSLAPRSEGGTIVEDLRRDGSWYLVCFGFTCALLIVAWIALALGFAVVERIDSSGAFSREGALIGIQASNLVSAPDAVLEMRVETGGARGDEHRASRLELVSLRAGTFRGIVPGMRPLSFALETSLPEPEIAEWLSARGARASLAGEDVARIREFAQLLRGSSREIDDIALPGPWREIGERARFPFESGMGQAPRNAIVVAILVLLLAPCAWSFGRLGRRILRRSRSKTHIG